MTIFMLDASALAKRYVVEPGTPLMNRLFQMVGCSRLRCLTIGAVEAFSVIVRQRNAGSITPRQAALAALALHREVLYSEELVTLPAPDALVLAAIPLIQRHHVNTADAVVLRGALDLQAQVRAVTGRVVLVASDGRLLRAADAEGLPVLDPEREDLAHLEALARA